MADRLYADEAQVRRNENRPETRATVLQATYDEADSVWNYEIAYFEGGSGWWPESELIAGWA